MTLYLIYIIIITIIIITIIKLLITNHLIKTKTKTDESVVQI